jgi:hypothetical protein
MSIDASANPANLLAGQCFTASSKRAYKTLSLSSLLGRMGVTEQPKTYAPSPVWAGSTTKQVKFQPMSKQKAVKVWHDARRFERQTRMPGLQDGAIGRNGLAVLHALLFDFLNYASGTLYPSRQAIANMANISLRSVDRGLAKLKLWGVVHWLRRCVEEWCDGRFTLKQETNAYAVLPPTQWRGYTPPEAPPPDPATWGACPALPDAVTLAVEAGREGGGIAAQIAVLESDERDSFAATLARLGRAIAGRKC